MTRFSRRSILRGSAALLSLLVNMLLLTVPLDRVASGTKADESLQLTWISAVAPLAPELPASTVPLADATPSLPALLPRPKLDIPDVVDEAATVPGATDAAPYYVRYVRDITARIQRAWSVPSIQREQHCRLRIQLSPAGEVNAVTLQPCDADPALQASIADAIRRVSPLPVDGGGVPADLLLDFAVSAASSGGLRSSIQPASL